MNDSAAECSETLDPRVQVLVIDIIEGNRVLRSQDKAVKIQNVCGRHQLSSLYSNLQLFILFYVNIGVKSLCFLLTTFFRS